MWKRFARLSLLGLITLASACSSNEGAGATSSGSQGGSGGNGGAAGSIGKGGSSGAAGSVAVAGSAGVTNGGSANAGQGGAPAAGSGGSGGSAGAGGYSSLGGFGGAPEDKPDTVEIGVRNGCAFPIWIHGAGNGGTLQPDDQQLEPMDIVWYDAPEQWSAARVTAYGDGPRQGELEKVEMTFGVTGDGEILNYNVTYVDWLGLPVEVDSTGGGGDCKKVGCYVPQSQVTQGCPDNLLEGKRCLAARSYCLNGNHAEDPYCSALDDEIAQCVANEPDCAGAADANTADVYACTGFFGGSPKWCAALNRHMVGDPDSTQLDLYYQTEPYNTYAKWVHQVCPGIYAFPYDDYPSNAGESGFHACTQATELRITFCPSG